MAGTTGILCYRVQNPLQHAQLYCTFAASLLQVSWQSSNISKDFAQDPAIGFLGTIFEQPGWRKWLLVFNTAWGLWPECNDKHTHTCRMYLMTSLKATAAMVIKTTSLCSQNLSTWQTYETHINQGKYSSSQFHSMTQYVTDSLPLNQKTINQKTMIKMKSYCSITPCSVWV